MKAIEISRDSIVSWSPTPVATEVNSEIVLMSLDRDRCYGLGETGSEIWRRLKTPIRVAELAGELEREYDAAPGEIEGDLLRTLRQFAEEGLIDVQ